MKRFKLAILTFFFLLSIPVLVNAEDGWEDVEKSTDLIKFDTGIDFEKLLESKVNKLNSDEMTNQVTNNSSSYYTYRYELNVVKHKELEEDTTKKNSEKKVVDDLFDTEEDANKYFDAIEMIPFSYKENKSVEEINKTRTDKGNETSCICKSNNCVDEISLLETNKSENQKLIYNISHIEEVLGEVKFVDYYENNNLKLFDTEDEANTFINSYSPSESGWKFINNKLEEVKIKNAKTAKLEETYNTEAEATTALNDFKEIYPSATGTITPEKNSNKNIENTTLEPTEYAAKELAEARAAAITSDTAEKKVTASVQEKNTNSSSIKIEDIETKQFSTEAEANAALEALRNNYVIDNYEIQTIPYEEITWGTETSTVVGGGSGSSTAFNYNHLDVEVLNAFTYIDVNGVQTPVTGNLAVTSVKINGNQVAMAGPSTDPNTKKIEYTSVNRRDLNITDKSKVEITGTVTYKYNNQNIQLPFTISGYLNENQNVCGGYGNSKGFDLEFESIKIIDNKVKVDANISNKYKLVGTMHTVSKSWLVSVTTLTYGYDYKLNASANYEEQISKYKVLSKFQKINTEEANKLTYSYDTTVNYNLYKLSYDQYSYDLVQYADANWIIQKKLMNFDDTSVPPQTGIDDSLRTKLAILFNLIVIAFGLYTYKLFKKN